MVRLVGEADRVKSGTGGAAFTVRLMEVVWVRLPPVPLIVTLTLPVAAVALAVRVRMLLPVVELGLNEAVTPLGSGEVTDKPTELLKPFAGLTVIVVVPPIPP